MPIDNIFGIAGSALNTSIAVAFRESAVQLLGQTGQRALPVEVRPQILYNPEMRSPNFFLPGVIGIVLQIATTFATAMSLVRERERAAGNAYSFGIFIDSIFCGEVNLNSVTRGSMQSATVGYWVDHAKAGHGYVPEAVAVVTRFAFEQLRLHRLEICIIPRNANSLRVVHKLEWRYEGCAERFLEINGLWEDHDRFGFTSEEWTERAEELSRDWL